MTDSELANNHVDVHRSSFDSRELNPRTDGLHISNAFEYPMDAVSLDNAVSDKSQL